MCKKINRGVDKPSVEPDNNSTTFNCKQDIKELQFFEIEQARYKDVPKLVFINFCTFFTENYLHDCADVTDVIE